MSNIIFILNLNYYKKIENFKYDFGLIGFALCKIQTMKHESKYCYQLIGTPLTLEVRTHNSILDINT